MTTTADSSQYDGQRMHEMTRRMSFEPLVLMHSGLEMKYYIPNLTNYSARDELSHSIHIQLQHLTGLADTLLVIYHRYELTLLCMNVIWVVSWMHYRLQKSETDKTGRHPAMISDINLMTYH